MDYIGNPFSKTLCSHEEQGRSLYTDPKQAPRLKYKKKARCTIVYVVCSYSFKEKDIYITLNQIKLPIFWLTKMAISFGST